jgi:C4-dicarboxylate-specific signal transduction histidine kinase
MTPSKRSSKSLLDRPARLRGLALLALLSSMLAILGGMIWRNLDRLDRVQAYVGYSHRIQDAGLSLQRALVDTLSGRMSYNREDLARISTKIRALSEEEAHLASDTPVRLGQVEASLARAANGKDGDGKTELFDALRVMHEILDAETEQREKVLEAVGREALVELEAAMSILVAILILTWLFLRRRILAPLHDLGLLLLNLAKEEFTPISVEHLDPLLSPVFHSYNVMVAHLAELEETKRMYAMSLEAEVRSATQALLEQQRSLARAEKLAAVGELAASLAHELRNPLAGIQMSCANLRQELQLPDQIERLDLIGAELKRMTKLLNELLEQGRQAPVPARDFDIGELLRELLALTRYQVPAHIKLMQETPPGLVCHLPDCSLRQALLNLILNAAQAMDETPGIIRITARKEHDALVIEVDDDGPGFNANLLHEGIRAFGTSRARGTGLGLVVVQRFVRDMGGRIELSNRAPRGARVRLLLPKTGVTS